MDNQMHEYRFDISIVTDKEEGAPSLILTIMEALENGNREIVIAPIPNPPIPGNPPQRPPDLKPGNKTPDWMEHFKPPFTHRYTSVLNADRNIVLIVRGCDHLSNKLSDLEVMSVAREEMTKTIADMLNKLAGKQNLKMK